ncbi:SMC-Scp complex subunit ScpB [Mesorhizobium loti]|uniref:SMC-Scp complex subunit ScpB n=1 Tax=Rhizobium loti TaxID=381 RepID=UPI000B088BB5
MFDRELEHLPAEARWREWMHRVEAMIFAASEPVGRETLARIVGKNWGIELLIDDIREELRGLPYDLVAIAGGWQHRSRPTPMPFMSRQARANRAAICRNRRRWC